MNLQDIFNNIGNFFINLYQKHFALIIILIVIFVALIVLFALILRKRKKREKHEEEIANKQAITQLTTQEIENISKNVSNPSEFREIVKTETTPTEEKVETLKDNQETEKPKFFNNNMTLLRLLDLDRLSIKQSRQKDEEKEELLYVLDVFTSEIKDGDKSKIKLSYLAYYYALRPYRKIQTNLKEITEILMDEKII